MAGRIFCDYHHSGLLRSLIMLFEDRFGFDIYRPVSLDWYNEGFWRIWPSVDTANQYLSLDQEYRPVDGTPQLNGLSGELDDGVWLCRDPGTPGRPTRACSLEYFRSKKWDYVIASIPQHIEPFGRLAKEVGAKLIVQVGNEWSVDLFEDRNVLASIAPRPVPSNSHVIFYHQEIDLHAFRAAPPPGNKRVMSFINCLPLSSAWCEFLDLERLIGGVWSSFGGQCRDGGVDGLEELGRAMRASDLIFHVKPGGDGFGHVLHNAYCAGRPVITRRSHYKNQWGEKLLVDGTCIDLDMFPNSYIAGNAIKAVLDDPDVLTSMSENAIGQFEQVVDFEAEAEVIKGWLENCK